MLASPKLRLFENRVVLLLTLTVGSINLARADKRHSRLRLSGTLVIDQLLWWGDARLHHERVYLLLIRLHRVDGVRVARELLATDYVELFVLIVLLLIGASLVDDLTSCGDLTVRVLALGR